MIALCNGGVNPMLEIAQTEEGTFTVTPFSEIRSNDASSSLFLLKALPVITNGC